MENKNQPAFPINEETTDRIDAGISIYTGLTKREYFAGLAMQATNLEAYADTFGNEWAVHVVKDSIALADELLKQLED